MVLAPGIGWSVGGGCCWVGRQLCGGTEGREWQTDRPRLCPCAAFPRRRDPRQKWLLAAAAFEHCRLVLAALVTAPPPSSELLARPPPGLLVVESVLAGGAALQALLHVLGPGVRELEVRGSCTAAAHSLYTSCFAFAWQACCHCGHKGVSTRGGIYSISFYLHPFLHGNVYHARCG